MTDSHPGLRERRLPARFRDGAVADIQTPGSAARANARVNRARRRAAREVADTRREGDGEHGPVEQLARLNLGGDVDEGGEGGPVERPRRQRRAPSRFREGDGSVTTPGSVARGNARVNRTRRRAGEEGGVRAPQEATAHAGPVERPRRNGRLPSRFREGDGSATTPGSVARGNARVNRTRRRTGEEGGVRTPQESRAPNSTSLERPAAVSSDFPTVNYVDLGERNVTCRFCGAKLWPMEKTRTSLCCHKGQTAWLSQVFDQPAPEPLKTLFARDIPHSKRLRFMKQIRAYNSALAMASSQVRMANPESGVSMLAIQGTVYHNIGALQPSERQEPRFAQLWILDNEEGMLESRIRSHSGSDLDPELLRELQTMLLDSNSFVRQFRQVRDIPEEQIQTYRFYIRTDGNIEARSGDSNARDHRRYRPPTDQEQVAGFMPGGEHEGVDEGRSLIVACRDDRGLRRISDCNAAFDPLFFVLLHPRGELGWHPGLKRAGGGNLTNRQWAAYFMHDRDNTNCHTVHAGRLYQAWIIDQYAKIETQRLRFLRRADSQKRLRVDVYQGLLDSLNGREGEQMRLGRLVLLPSSFIGGPRFMTQCYQDAMALVREFGKPDLFITMTCNPNWPEIQRELLPGQSANDRPDLVARVFKMKLKQLTDDITVHRIFGDLQGMVYVIEFQKRGLPHAHLLVILKPGFKPVSPEDVDRFVWAEICGKEEHPLLYEMIVTHMLHGPCGPANPHCPCMENGVCSKKFPKQYSDNTTFTNDSFPTYRRREGATYTKRTARGEFTFDNRWVVPYNPFLLCKYQCHINVEVCNTVAAVKYLYKYVYKGHDRAEVRVHRAMATSDADLQNEVIDEVNEYVDGRYISASEAACRIYGFDLHEMIPSVHRLPVHLPGQQNVHFREGEDPSAVLERAGNTKLTGWFEFNKAVAAQQAADPSASHPPAQTTTYPNIAKIAVWDKANKQWKPRTQGGRAPVGRMYHVSPTDQERFYLRMLLLIVPGAMSFEDVRTTGEGPSAIVHDTFKAACVARGLLQDDGEWRKAMEEARLASTAKALRLMFVSLLLYVEVENPLALWTEFKNDMAEDFLHAARTSNPTREYDEHLYALALADIQRHLGETNKSLEHYGLPPIRNTSQFGAVEEELALYDTNKQREEVERMLPLLNQDQKAAYDVLLNTIEKDPESRACNVYFLDGVGGSGKTTLYNTILKKVRSMGKIAIAVASSGIAALLLEGGKTAHSRFKIPVGGLDADSTCFITQQSPLAELIRHAAMIIWDEAAMVHRHAVEAVDRSLRDIIGIDKPVLRGKPFGGIVTLFGGDFRQILPVVKHGGKADTVAACINRSHLWMQTTVLKLKINMRVRRLLTSGEQNAPQRAQDLQNFADMLQRIGEGSEHVHSEYGEDCIRIPASMCCDDHSVEALINRVYGDVATLSTVEQRAAYFTSRVILAPRNEDVDAINKIMHERLRNAGGDIIVREYISADSTDENTGHFPVEFLNSLNISGVPPHRLHLQLGCPVVLLRNLSFGLANGTRMVVTQMMERCIELQVVTGPLLGNKVLLPRLTITPSDAEDYPFTLKRRQFPVRPAYAMTINKAQGQTFEKVGIYLHREVFSHGQLYVGLSRAGEQEAVAIAAPNAFKDEHGVYVRNVVYKNALLLV